MIHDVNSALLRGPDRLLAPHRTWLTAAESARRRLHLRRELSRRV